MMGGWMYGMGWGGLLLILLLIVVIVGVMMASRGGRSSGSRSDGDTAPPRTDSRKAQEILKERYARGEITQEEYEEMRHDLEA